MRFFFILVLSALGIYCSYGASAQLQSQRTLSDVESRSAIEALLKDPAAALSEDPSCKADLTQPGSMSIAQGLAIALLRAATDKKPVAITVDCFVRPGYPLAPGQEYCRLAFVPDRGPRALGYGLVFVMDWNKKNVASGSVECY
jgi:hypothetical protein